MTLGDGVIGGFFLGKLINLLAPVSWIIYKGNISHLSTFELAKLIINFIIRSADAGFLSIVVTGGLGRLFVQYLPITTIKSTQLNKNVPK